MLLETLSDSTLVKKRPKDANRAFLHAMVNRMTPVCLQILEKGFPVNVNHPVMGAHDHNSADKFYFPSYFQMAVSFELVDVVKAMIKLKADVNLSWYQVTPLQNACVKGNEAIIRLLIENGASPNQSLGLEDYILLSKLKPAHRKATSPTTSNPSPQTPSSNPDAFYTRDYPRQAGQKGPLALNKEYLENKHIYLFELAALRGHTVIASFLLDQ
jgi:ankyrin repeat protein